MVLGNHPVLGHPTVWMIVGQGPIALAVGAGGGCLDIFTPLYLFSLLSPSLWETARYRLKYCLKEPLNPKQLTSCIVIGGSVSISKMLILLHSEQQKLQRVLAVLSATGLKFY